MAEIMNSKKNNRTGMERTVLNLLWSVLNSGNPG